MSQFIAQKDPSAVLDYGINWGSWLSNGDSITASSWVIESNTVTNSLAIDSSNIQGSIAIVWLSGGTADVTYSLTNQIGTSQGRITQRTISVLIKEM